MDAADERRSGAGEQREPVPGADDRAGDAVRRVQVVLERPGRPRSGVSRASEPGRTSRARRSRCCRRAHATSSCWCPRRGGSPWRSCRGSSRAPSSGRPWKPPQMRTWRSWAPRSVVTFTHPLLASAIYDAADPGRTSSRAPRPRGDARRPGGACPAPLEDDHGPRRGGCRRAGTGGRHLARTWGSAAGRRAVGGRGSGHPDRVRTPRPAWAAGSARWTPTPAPATRWRHRRRWTRGRRWQSSRSSRPRCWCGGYGWPRT